MENQELQENKVKQTAKRFSYGPLFLFAGILFPVAVNLLVFYAFVEPPQKKVACLSSFAEFLELKPRVEALIAEGNQLTGQSVSEDLSANDAAEVLKEIRELAKVHKIEAKGLQIQSTGPGRETAAGKILDKTLDALGLKKVSVSMDMTGKYARIARWLASLDRRMEIQIDNFALTPSAGDNCQLRLGLKILLRKS